MTDIVARLNEQSGVRSDGDAKVMIDAAAEIERLRAALDKYGGHRGLCTHYGGRDCNCGWEETKRANEQTTVMEK